MAGPLLAAGRALAAFNRQLPAAKYGLLAFASAAGRADANAAGHHSPMPFAAASAPGVPRTRGDEPEERALETGGW